MANGVATVNLTVKVQNAGDRNKRNHEMVLSGLQRCPGGLLYISANSVNLKALGVSCFYGVYLHHVSCKSTASNALFVFTSRGSRACKSSAICKVPEGEVNYFCPTCNTEGTVLWASNGIAVQFSILGR